jgi:hypothetical protein
LRLDDINVTIHEQPEVESPEPKKQKTCPGEICKIHISPKLRDGSKICYSPMEFLGRTFHFNALSQKKKKQKNLYPLGYYRCKNYRSHNCNSRLVYDRNTNEGWLVAAHEDCCIKEDVVENVTQSGEPFHPHKNSDWWHSIVDEELKKNYNTSSPQQLAQVLAQKVHNMSLSAGIGKVTRQELKKYLRHKKIYSEKKFNLGMIFYLFYID